MPMDSNPYATEWMAGGPADTPQGFDDEPVEYAASVTVGATSTLVNNPILIDGMYEVRIDRINFDVFDQANATGFAARFRGGDGRLLMTDFCQISPLTVDDLEIGLFPPIVFAPGETFQFDIRNDNAAQTVFQVVIKGQRRRKE